MRDIRSVLLSRDIEPEIKRGQSWEAYKDLPALNPSSIVKAIQSRRDGLTLSMKHFLHAWGQPGKDTDSMQLGRAAHCLVFEPREFTSRFVYYEGKRDKRVKAYQEFLEAYEGYDVLTKAQWEEAQRIALALTEDDRVREAISNGMAEVTVLSQECAMRCRGRMDWIKCDEAGAVQEITDLKTAVSCEPGKFSRDFYKYHYDIKLGLYRRWVGAAVGREPPVRVIVVENSPPYDVSVIPIPDAVLYRGAELGYTIIRAIRQAIDRDYWPGVAEGEATLDVPPWEMDEELTGAEEM